MPRRYVPKNNTCPNHGRVNRGANIATLFVGGANNRVQVFVDADLFELFLHTRWHVRHRRDSSLELRSGSTPAYRVVFPNPPPGSIPVFLNGNRFDLRRKNIEIISRSEYLVEARYRRLDAEE